MNERLPKICLVLIAALHAMPAAAAPCDTARAQRALTLDDVVELALCNNPQTRIHWATVRAQAEQVGSAEAGYLPGVTLSGSANSSRTSVGGAAAVSGSGGKAALTASYLLYDFGARAASLEVAKQSLVASEAARDAALQSVYLGAVQAYFSLLSARAQVEALRAAERLAQESLEAAQARYQSGSATPADRLQAQTALSQAVLNRISGEGNAAIAAGTLASQLGYSAMQQIELAPAGELRIAPLAEREVGELLEQALRSRPDLRAAEAQLKAAEAQADAARAAGRPSLSLSAGTSYGKESSMPDTRTDSIGVALNVPLFDGFRTTHQTRSAEAQAEARGAERDRLARQIELEVWKAWQELRTSSQALRSAGDVVASAEQSERMTLGRYKAGLGNMLDVLSAQSTLAGARQQWIAARFNFVSSRFALLQALGQLDIPTAEANGETLPPDE